MNQLDRELDALDDLYLDGEISIVEYFRWRVEVLRVRLVMELNK